MRNYLIAGIAVGILQIVDAVVSYAHIGAAERVGLVLSGVEVLWAIVSVAVVFRGRHTATRLLAVGFVLYVAIGWLLAVSVLSPYARITAPIWSVILGGLFGCAYAAGSAYLLRRKTPGEIRSRRL